MTRIVETKQNNLIIRVRPLWVAVVFLCLAVPALAQISDDFSAEQLNTSLWQMVDPLGDSQLILSPGLVTLDIPAGVAHNPDLNGNNAPRLIQPLPDTDFILEARFESVPTLRGQEQGLMVLQDDGSYIRLAHRYDKQQLYLAWSRVINHEVRERGSLAVAATDTLNLRLTRQADQWTCDHAADGGPWATAFDFTHVMQVTRGGFYAANTRDEDPDNPYDRDDPPFDKAAAGLPAAAFAVVVDYVFDANNPIVPEDGALTPRFRNFDGLKAFYFFRENPFDVVFDYAATSSPYHLTQLDAAAVAWLPDHGLSLTSPTLVTAPLPATTLNQAIMASGALTIEAWIDPLNTIQSGPARIMTLSGDPLSRNATLAQGQWSSLPSDVIDVRLRTTLRTDNGQPDMVTPAGSVSGGLQHIVFTRDAQGATHVYIDGVEVFAATTAGDLTNWDDTYSLAFGGEMDGTRNWLGDLHLAAVYDRALTPAEVVGNFEAGPDGGDLPPMPPAVILQGLTPGRLYEADETITMNALANDADGSIVAVEFRVGDQLLNRDETVPYAFTWTHPAVGGHQILAVAIDDEGLETESARVPVAVNMPSSYQAALTVSDAFYDAELGAPWLLNDTSGGAGISQGNGSVMIDLPATSQDPWSAPTAVLKAYQPEIDTDLGLELMIDSTAWSGDAFTGLDVADSLGASIRFIADRLNDTWTLSWGSANSGDPILIGTLELGPLSGPLWLQLRRHGSTSELFYANDGLNWQAAAVVTQALTMNRAGWFAGARNGTATVALDHAFNLASPIIPEDGQPGDYDGPVISQVTGSTALDNLVIRWQTDELAYYRLQYGLTTAYELGLVEGDAMSLAHRAEVLNLISGQPHHLQLTCFDGAGNITVSDDIVFFTDGLAVAAAGPIAGDIYRESIRGIYEANAWRVTDPDAGNSGAAVFLPNPVLDLVVPDLTGAVRAELVIDRWGGHPGTTGKKIRLNGGSWLHLPELTTTGSNSPECYIYQDNPLITLPLDQLVAGTITLEGTADEQSCYSFNWGQWGWYGVVLRVYYDNTLSHPTGSFLSPATGDTITDIADISVATTDPTGGGTVDLVHVLGRYVGFDTDGGGDTGNWHRRYRREYSSATVNLEGIIGTATTAPWTVTWAADWIPDQISGSVALQARVRDNTGVWYVTEVDGLSLNHSTGVVKAYSMLDMPQDFWVRAGQSKSTTFNIPGSDTLSLATEARLMATTWNGSDQGVITINGVQVSRYFGRSHFYDLDTFHIDTTILGPDINTLTVSSNALTHGVEVLWPGPLLKVRYGTGAANLAAVPGDLNGDGIVNVGDSRLVLGHVVGQAPLSGFRAALADIDHDGKTNITDAVIMAGLKSASDDGRPLPTLSARPHPDFPRQIELGLDMLPTDQSLELVITGRDLATVLKNFDLAKNVGTSTAWHVQGDTLRLARIGSAAGSEIGTLTLSSGLSNLVITGKSGGQELDTLEFAVADVPTRFELVGNYPNPFNPATTIAFNLPRAAMIRLRVHDVRGQVVATLAEGQWPPGRHKVLWNGRDHGSRPVASGTFFYRLEANGQIWTQKMLLLK